MGNPFFGIGKRMSKVIHRVNAPFVPGAVMMGLHDPINDRVPHIEIGGSHINFGTQNEGAVVEFPGGHPGKKIFGFLNRPVAEGAFPARFGQGSPVFTNLIRGQFVHIGQAFINEFQGAFVDIIKIIRSVIYMIPMESEPADIFQNGIHILGVFFGGVGVVQAQVAASVVTLGDRKVNADGLGVANVQIPVRFRRKTGLYSVVYSFGQILINGIQNKVGGFGGLFFTKNRFIFFFHSAFSCLQIFYRCGDSD